MAKRSIVHIDEDKCDGCGLCVPGCAEGALQIIDGKAKLVSDIYCDGLGACLGECPQGAITMIEREAEDFSEEAVKEHLENLQGGSDHAHGHDAEEDQDSLACGCPSTMVQSFGEVREKKPVSPSPVAAGLGGCPGSRSQSFEKAGQGTGAASGASVPGGHEEGHPVASRLGNWPVQIMLVPVQAPYLNGADIVIAADCAPFAYADFHRRFLEGKTLLIGCPKLDDTEVYVRKLSEIFRQNDIRSIDIVYMEVPCCTGLVHLVKTALDQSGRNIPTTLSRVGIEGDFVEERTLGGAAA